MIQGTHRFPPMERVDLRHPAGRGAGAGDRAHRRPRRLRPRQRHPGARDGRGGHGQARAGQQARRHLRQDRRPHPAPTWSPPPTTRAAQKADALLTVGGGSVTDAAKMVGLCLGNDVTEPGPTGRVPRAASAPTARPCARRSTPRRCARPPSPPRCRPASSPRWPAAPTPRGPGEAELRPPADDAARGDPRSRGHRPHAGMAVPLHRHPRRRSRGGGHLLDQQPAVLRRHLAARPAAAGARAGRGEGRSGQSGGAARLPAGRLDVDHRLAERRARRAPATASATCWAAPRMCRTATPPASCCRTCCASTNR